MHYLSVVAIFKNESHVIKEWLEHYINEGVDHFYLIDNGSTDDYYKKIKNYILQNLITLVHDDSKWSQVELYNKHFLGIKNQSTWFLICDLDEFVYSRRRYKTIKHYLKWKLPWIGVIRIPWKIFGSSSHIQQPTKIIPAFTSRSLYDGRRNPGMEGSKKSLSKVIIRGSCLKHIDIHFSELDQRRLVISADNRLVSYREKGKNHPPVSQLISEQILRRSSLHLNHYPIQSYEWFMTVKCTRGAADSEAHEDVRNENYFKEFDDASNSIKDDELAKKKYNNK